MSSKMSKIWLISIVISLNLLNPIQAQPAMKMDGNENDWINDPVLIQAPNNIEGFYPANVGAAVTDIVDIKEIKAKLIEDKIYFFMRFYGSPAWPNSAHTSTFNGVPVYRHRGYYYFIVDLDNNSATGWDSFTYEDHETTVAYRHSLGDENAENIGGEAAFNWWSSTKFTTPHPDSGKVQEILYSAGDVTFVCPVLAQCGPLYCFEFFAPEPDTIKQMCWEGTFFDSVLNKDIWVGHGWGEDFLEVGYQLDAFLNYWQELGFEYLQPGDTIGLAGFVETPIDDWGVDFTTRGELVVGTNSYTPLKNLPETKKTFILENNYPNPFNQETTICYTLPHKALVSLEIFNTTGQKICTLVQGEQNAGPHQVKWNAKKFSGGSVASGVYLSILKSGKISLVNRMALLQ